MSRPAKSERIIIPGAVGNIEAVVEHAEPSVARRGVVVCCHPHPVHGGTMTNKVIHTVAKSVVNLGLTAVRFNFRGVGASEGEYADGLGEQDDLRAVVQWVNEHYAESELWLAGFSFGSFIAAMTAHEFSVHQLVSIAPPVFRFDFGPFKHPLSPWLAVMGDADEVVDFGATEQWVQSLEPQPEWVVMKGAGHFFHSRLVELRDILEQNLANRAAELPLKDN